MKTMAWSCGDKDLPVWRCVREDDEVLGEGGQVDLGFGGEEEDDGGVAMMKMMRPEGVGGFG